MNKKQLIAPLIKKLKTYPLLFLKWIINTLVAGIFIGLVVAFLLSIPTISINDTGVVFKDGKIDFMIYYVNTGKSAAVNLTTKCLYGLDGDNHEQFISLKTDPVDKIEAGGLFSLEGHEKLFNKERAVILVEMIYHDTSKIRELINKRVLGNSYRIIGLYQIKKGYANLAEASQQQKEKYMKTLLERLKGD
jgi:hypothetical protein